MQESDKITEPEPPKPIAIGTLHKLSRSTCKLQFESRRRKDGDVVASGFFGSATLTSKVELTAAKKVTTLFGLVTNHHVIGDEKNPKALLIERDNRFYIKCYDPTTSTECPRIPVVIGRDTGFIFTDKALDFTFIELTEIFRRQFLQQQKVEYLAMDDSSGENPKKLLGLPVFVLQFPAGGELKYSSGNVMMLSDRGHIIYTAPTAGGSSGSPVFDLKTNRLIGIHRASSDYEDPLETIVADCEKVLLTQHDEASKSVLANVTSQLQKLREALLVCHRVAAQIGPVVDKIQSEMNKLHELDEKMRTAIQDGDCDRIDGVFWEINEAGASLEHLRYFDETPLHLAARLGDREIAECLLSMEPLLLEARTRDTGLSALTIAAQHGHVDLVQQFLIEERGASLETSSECENAFGAAAFAGQIHVLDALLENKPLNLDETKNKKGETCLHRAAAGGSSKCLKHVISVFDAKSKEQLDIRDNAGRTALMVGAFFGNADCVDVLLDAGANYELFTRESGTAVHLAVGSGHVDTIRRFLFHHRGGFNVAKLLHHGTDLLRLAVSTGSVEVFNDLYYFMATQDKDMDKEALLRVALLTDKSGDVLKFLLRRGASLASTQTNLTGRNVLHCVRTIAALNIVLEELSSRADLLKELLLQKDTESGQTPLMTIVDKCPGDFGILEKLLDAVKIKLGDDFVVQLLDERNKSRHSLLHFLARVKPNVDSVAIARLLLERGAKIEAADYKNRTAAFNAAHLQNFELLQFLLTKDLESGQGIITSPKEIFKLLYMAVLRNRVDILDWLLLFEEEQMSLGNESYQNQKLVDLRDDMGNRVLQVACTIANNGDIIRLLLRSGANPFEHVRGQSALHCATAANHANALWALLDWVQSASRNGKQALLTLDNQGLTVLHTAILVNADVAVFKVLMQYAAEFGCFTELLEAKMNFKTALLMAAVKGNGALTQCLLDTNADINAHDNAGLRAIHFAASGGHCHVLKVLLNHKNNGGLQSLLQQKTNTGDTALLAACRHGQRNAVKTLLESAEGDVALLIKQINTTDKSGMTPLFLVVINGDVTMVKYLLYVGANALPAGSPSTAFHLAAAGGHVDVFDALIDAYPNQEEAKSPNTGETPLQTALAQGQVLFARRLLANFGDRLLNAKDNLNRSVDFYIISQCKDKAKQEEMSRLLAEVRQAARDGIPPSVGSVTSLTVNQEQAIAAISSRKPGKLYALIEEDRGVLDLRTPTGDTIFHVAAGHGDVAILNVLLTTCDTAKQRQLLSSKNAAGESALTVATKSTKQMSVFHVLSRIMPNDAEL